MKRLSKYLLFQLPGLAVFALGLHVLDITPVTWTKFIGLTLIQLSVYLQVPWKDVR